MVVLGSTMLALGALAALGLGSPVGTLGVAVVALLVVVLIGRFLLSVAWKVLLFAGVVIGALWVLSLLG